MEPMPKKGDVFVGKINDLSQFDAAGWKRRDISFYKNEINRKEKFDYPAKNNTITLIDAENNRYELNITKPDVEKIVCLGTPSRLKQWYKMKGFDDKRIKYNEKILYFIYTGRAKEFLILTEAEYKSGIAKKLLEGQRPCVMKYVVYVNKPNNKAIVHSVECGKYTSRKRNESHNGFWTQPFPNFDDAWRYAKNTEKKIVDTCSFCCEPVRSSR